MTKTQTAAADPAERLVDCPRCKGAAPLMTPLKVVEKRNAVYGCKHCGFTFTASGGAFVADARELRDYFRGAELGQKTLVEAIGGERLNPATRVLLEAQLVAYGLQMWNDGLKTGLLMGATSEQELGRLATEAADSNGCETAETEALRAYLNGGRAKDGNG